MFRAVPISEEIYNKFSNNTQNTGQIRESLPQEYLNYAIGQLFPNSYYAVIDKYFQVIRTDSNSILSAKLIIKLKQNNNVPQGKIYIN